MNNLPHIYLDVVRLKYTLDFLKNILYNINVINKKEVYEMTKIKNYFELNQKYKFDPTDLTATIFVLCTILGIMGYNVTPLFLIGSAIGTAFCWQARRINLIVLNVALFVLNLVSFIKMF
jgi:hypothetical protein